jgi:hypothetical protein
MCYRKGSEILKGCRIIHIVLDFIPIFSWHTEWELRCELHAISPRVVTLEVFLENRVRKTSVGCVRPSSRPPELTVGWSGGRHAIRQKSAGGLRRSTRPHSTDVRTLDNPGVQSSLGYQKGCPRLNFSKCEYVKRVHCLNKIKYDFTKCTFNLLHLCTYVHDLTYVL